MHTQVYDYINTPIIISTSGQMTYANAAANNIFGAYLYDIYEYLLSHDTSLSYKINNHIITGTIHKVHNDNIITYIINTDDNLDYIADKLSDLNEEFQSLIYVTSHDLQEPIRIINSYCKLISKKISTIDSDKLSTYLESIIQNSNYAMQMIKDLLDYARIGQSKYADVIIKDIISDIKNLFKLKAKSNNVELHFSKSKILKESIFCNRAEISRVFQNLIDNAIKFKSNQNAKITVSFDISDSNIIFSISDNGIGIPEKHRNKIFEMFGRLYPKHKYPGTGMGLAICQKIITKHNGKIWFESSPNTTTFFFTLPRTQS